MIVRALLTQLTRQILVRLQTRLVLRLTRFGRHTNPFQFALECLLLLARLLLFGLQTRGLLLEPTGVISFPWNALAAIELEDVLRHVVEEVAIVGDCDHCPGKLGQIPLQPRHAFGVQMVRGLVEQQHVRLFQQYATECHATTLAT